MLALSASKNRAIAHMVSFWVSWADECFAGHQAVRGKASSLLAHRVVAFKPIWVR